MGGLAGQRQSRSGVIRRSLAVLLAAAAPALVACVWFVESNVQSRQLQHRHRVSMVTEAIQQQTSARGDDLRALEMMLRPRNELDWRMFDDLSRFGLLERDDVSACAWAPRVPLRHRAQYETFVEASAYRSFRITERDETGRLRDAAPREEHFPLHFVAPAESSGLPLGIDVASDPEIEAAMERARDENAVGALLASSWARDNADTATVLVMIPVYRPHAPLDSVQARRVALEGFLLASVLVAPEVGAAITAGNLGELQANLLNPTQRPPRPFSPLDTSGPFASGAARP